VSTPDLQPTLVGPNVIVRPVAPSDWQGMFAAAADPEIWTHHPARDRYMEPVFRRFFEAALASSSALSIIDRRTGAIIGSSRYHGHDPEIGEIEIGWTFLARRWWGGACNAEVKRLMLDHAFSFVDTVVFWVGESNWRSQRAMEKIGGARRSGVFERSVDGSLRRNVVFEISKDRYRSPIAAVDGQLTGDIEPEFERYVRFAERLADAARAQSLPHFREGAAIDAKPGLRFDPVTDADRNAERAIRNLIAATFPAHGIIGEEFGSERSEAEWRWVVDPIDGTRAFICGAPTWTTLIALERRERPVIGVIDQPFTDERWIGCGGRTIYRRAGLQRSCRTSRVAAPKDARISTTDPRWTAYFAPEEAAAFGELCEKARLARFGFDAHGYGLLALGEIDLIVEAGLKHYDYAALIPVIEGAGGVVTGWRGEAVGGGRARIVAAASRDLHAAAVEGLSAVD